jgi:hypothetical protein
MPKLSPTRPTWAGVRQLVELLISAAAPVARLIDALSRLK